MSFGTPQFTHAASLLDEKIAELEAAITSASNDAQARVSRDLKRAWESVYNALSFSPNPAASRGVYSYSAWAANSSPRFPPNANVPLEPHHGSHEPHNERPAAGDAELTSDSLSQELSIHDMAGSTLCDSCGEHATDILWVCISCKGRHRLCNGCKASSAAAPHPAPDSSSSTSAAHHRFVAWPFLERTIGAGQYVVCDCCSKAVVGVRWMCTECKSFDMCNDCANTTSHQHPLRPFYASETAMYPLNNAQYTCNHCNARVDPPVLCCLKCKDFHVCLKCTARGKMCGDHDFAAINIDSAHAASNSCAAEKTPETASPDSAEPNEKTAASAEAATCSSSSSSKGDASTSAGEPGSGAKDTLSLFTITCNECTDTVTGIRHKCTRCKNYDLCDNCYRNVTSVHPGHGFVHFGPPPSAYQAQHYPHQHPHQHPHGPHHRPSPNHHHGSHPRPRMHAHTPSHPHSPAHQSLRPPHRRSHHHTGPGFGIFTGISACRLVHPPFDGTPLAGPMSPPPPPSPPHQMPVVCPMPPPPPPSVPFIGCTMPVRSDKQQQTESVQRAEHGIRTDEEAASPKPVHMGISCDTCRETIVGTRYKCGNCIDYDLCEKCEPAADHNSDHLFVKICSPRATPSQKPMFSTVYPPVECTYSSVASPAASSSAIPPTAVVTPAATSARQASRCDKIMQTTKYVAVFVEDITIPDGTLVDAGETFVKIWSVANVGNTEWPKGTMLVHMDGEPSIQGNRKTMRVVIGKRYEQVGVAVDLVAPVSPGTHKSRWRLMTPDGYYFGSELWCTVVVESSAMAAVKADEVAATTNPATRDGSFDAPQQQSVVSAAESAVISAVAPAVANGLGITSSPTHSAQTTTNTEIAPVSTTAAVATTSVLSDNISERSNANGAASAESHSSDSIVDGLSGVFVKIGSDLMQEIMRLEQSIKELQLRQDMLEGGGHAHEQQIRSVDTVSQISKNSSETSASHIFDITSAPANIAEASPIKGYPHASSESVAASKSSSIATGQHYSDVDLLTSPPLRGQQEAHVPVSAGSDAHSETSSMREFYSSAARLEQLLNTSRVATTSSTSLDSHDTEPSVNQHYTHVVSRSPSVGGSNNDDTNDDGFEIVNDFGSNGGQETPKNI